MSNATQTLALDAEQAERVRAALIERLGINPEHVAPSSITFHWDHESARVQWTGYSELTAEEAASLVTSVITARPCRT